jgi:hypothetical protein
MEACDRLDGPEVIAKPLLLVTTPTIENFVEQHPTFRAYIIAQTI